MNKKERKITVEIGSYPKDLDDATYMQILDNAHKFAIQLPGHSQWPLRWRIDMEKWYQAAAAHFACNPDFMNPWHDPDKELPPFGTVVVAAIPNSEDDKFPVTIKSTKIPSKEKRNPLAHYDRYGFENLEAIPVAWSFSHIFPEWACEKLLKALEGGEQ